MKRLQSYKGYIVTKLDSDARHILFNFVTLLTL
jgi:hypothetical protein